jgi:hypothetical protein
MQEAFSNLEELQLKVQDILKRCKASDTHRSAHRAANHLINMTVLAGLSMSQLDGLFIEDYGFFLGLLFSNAPNKEFRGRNVSQEFERYCCEGDVVKNDDILTSVELAIALVFVERAKREIKIVEQVKSILGSRFPLDLEGYGGRIVYSKSGQTDVVLSHPDREGEIVFTCAAIDQKRCLVSGVGSHHGRLVF